LSVQKSVIIESAQQFAAKGKFDKAIAEWKKLLAEMPQDGNIYNNISDLYIRLNDKTSAIDACLKAAGVYREAGFELKGVAVLKKILKIDPNRIDIYEMLADINADRGLTGNAIEGYQQAAKLYMKNGSFKGAISVYQKLGRFTPQDPEIPLAVARLYQKQERYREAILSYEQAEAIYARKQMVSEAHHIVEEIIKIDPGYLKQLVAKEAALASIVETTAERDITLAPPQKIAEAFMGKGEETKASPFFLEEMEVFCDLIPYDASLPALSSSQKQIAESVLAAPSSVIGKPSYEDKSGRGHGVSDVVLDAHLSEADSYIRYGLNQSAIEKLLLVTELAPMGEGAYLRLKELYLKEGQKDKAAMACLSIVDIYDKRGDIDKKEALLRELHEIDPSGEYQKINSLAHLQDSGRNNLLQSKQETGFENFSDLAHLGFSPVETSRQEQSQEESFDLASAITQELGDLSVNSLAVTAGAGGVFFSDSGEAVQTQKKQQYLETCYHLGIAQKEMGNFTKAIREFEQALSGEGRFQEVLTLLAVCYAEQGDLEHAAAVLQKGVSDPRCRSGARLAISYDLASIYEQLGEKEKSFSLYKEIYRVNPKFRDVSGKVKEIPYRRPASAGSETLRAQEAAPLVAESTVPISKEKRRISYV